MSLVSFFAQATNATNAATAAAPDPAQAPGWTSMIMWIPVVVAFYFLLIRPQTVAKKKQEATIKGAKTGDKIVTSSGIHGVITNVKESTVIVKVADNVKFEIEKSHIDRTIKAATGTELEKEVVAKA